jgi:hypothetical protein
VKNKKLFITGISIFIFASFLNFTAALAQEKGAEVYKDKNNYFSFNPPADWTKEEIAADTVSQVNFHSPDGKAGLGIIAQLDDGDLNNLFSQKKDYIKDFRKRFPKGKFSVSWETLGGRKVVKVNFAIPQLIKQEQYFFYDQGVCFDLVYGVGSPVDFEKNNQLALDAFATIQRQKVAGKK